VEFRLLGPVEFWDDGCRVDLGHAKQRRVLAILLIEAGCVVPVGTLIDRVWDHAPPNAALNVLYGYASRLRTILRPYQIDLIHRCGGYLIDIDSDAVDVHRFRRLVSKASTTRDATVLDEALALWRGTPFAGISGSWIAAVRSALEDQHRSVIAERNEWYQRTGRHADVLSPLLPRPAR
jgi:DNA-binding SARP family transcriptional activator